MNNQWLSGFNTDKLMIEQIEDIKNKDVIDTYKEFKKWRKMTYKLSSPPFYAIARGKRLPPGSKKESFHFYSVKNISDKKVLGLLALLDGWPDTETLFIAMFYISSDFHSKGYGTDIMDNIISHANKNYNKLMIRVHCVDKYEPTFFYKHGFMSIKEMKQDRILAKYFS